MLFNIKYSFGIKDVGLGATRHSLVCARWDLATLDTDRTDIADVHGDTAKM